MDEFKPMMIGALAMLGVCILVVNLAISNATPSPKPQACQCDDCQCEHCGCGEK
jgi:hypothetical protein